MVILPIRLIAFAFGQCPFSGSGFPYRPPVCKTYGKNMAISADYLSLRYRRNHQKRYIRMQGHTMTYTAHKDFG